MIIWTDDHRSQGSELKLISTDSFENTDYEFGTVKLKIDLNPRPHEAL